MTNIIDKENMGQGGISGFFDRYLTRPEPPKLIPQDYPDGFVIVEQQAVIKRGEVAFTGRSRVALRNNQMPFSPFMFGGEQRINKMYYPGWDEPSTQILGPTETDVTIKGQLKDTRLKDEKRLYGYSQAVRDEIDAIRYRGNICTFTLGDWERWGYISKVEWKVIRKTRMAYDITLNIVSFGPPENAKFLTGDPRTIPFGSNEELRASGYELESFVNNGKEFVYERSIADEINAVTNDVAVAISIVTGYVDSVFSQVADTRQSIVRAIGLIDNTKRKVRSFRLSIGALNPFGQQQSLTNRYQQASYYSSLISNSMALTSLLERYREQFAALADTTPQARYLVKSGDTWQGISSEFYGQPDSWKQIIEFNNLKISDPVPVGTLIEIPESGSGTE